MALGYVSLLQRDVVGLWTPKGHHDNTIQYEYIRIHILGYLWTKGSHPMQISVLKVTARNTQHH